MKLFFAPQSPFARKVRAAAIELSLDDQIELEYAELVPGRLNAAYAESTNPLRKIPALIADDGKTIFDSTVICEYLDVLAGGNKLFPLAPSLRWQVLTNHALAQGMCESVILIRYETWLRPEAYRWPIWVEDHWDKINRGLQWFEENPVELRDPINVAHLALGSLLGYIDFRWPHQDWRTRYPDMADWFERMERRPSFATTKPISPTAL